MTLLQQLLRSKRSWMVLVTFVCHLLVHYRIIPDADIDAIADQLVLVGGAIGVIATKIIDHKNQAVQQS